MSISNISRDRARRRGVHLRRTLAPAMVVCFLPAALALDPNRSISQYIDDQWSAPQGFPGGAVNAIAQTPDGYLWIGAENGLVRFDGLTFHLFNHANSASFPAGPVLGLNTDDEGTLWIRLETPGLLRYRGGIFQQAFSDSALDASVTAMGSANGGGVLLARPGDLIRYSGGIPVHLAPGAANTTRLMISIAETADGAVWFGTRDAGLFALHDSRVAALGGLPDRKINCLLPGAGPELWIGTDNGLVRWDGKSAQSVVPAVLQHAQILALARDRDSNLWVGSSGGLVRIDAQGVASTDLSQNRRVRVVSALFEDREGSLWVGGTNGIERCRDSLFLTYPAGTDQRSEDSGPLYVDAAGRTWFGPSAGGLCWLKGSERGSVREAGLRQDVVYSIAGGPGEIWIGRQRGGLTRLHEVDGSFTARTYTTADGLAQGGVYAVHRSRDGSVWASTLNGGVTQLRNGHLTTYTTANGLASNSVSAIEEGSDGTVWFATANGLQSFAHGRWQAYVSQGLPPGRVNCLAEDTAGVIWIGTDAGLGFIRRGRLQTPRDPPQVLLEEVLGLADDGRGHLWIATSRHVVRAPRANLLGDVAGQGAVREFGLADGLPATEGVRRCRSVVMDHLGRIWFSLRGGASVASPARVDAISAPPIIHIQTVVADGQTLTEMPLRISASRHRITFGYIGLSLSVPDRVRYRYRLDDFEHEWSEPSAVRQSTYTNLSPGSYRFRVIASSGEGVWNSREAAIGLEIVPLVWQTWWFRLGILIACVFSAVAIYRLRSHQLMASLNLRFEERLAERTRIAQELHDTLLQGFLSASMQVHVAADRLRDDSDVKPILTRALELMRAVNEEGRNAIRGLRLSKSASLDLEQAFALIQQDLTPSRTADEPVAFRVIVEGQPRPLRPLIRDEVYGIGREALLNAFRHSRAKSIELELQYSATALRVHVRDDGRGIDPQILSSGRDGHWGLSGMQERADRIGAGLHVRTRLAAGTEVELSVPSHTAFEDDRKHTLTWLGKHFRRGQQPKARNGAGG